ncbi:phosphinothricin acetyltransferase [Rhodovulum bhavnagarense]|uniref:Phosphinothricin acetyltransferase n=1 Tax=Rhodovulum bhavnagarense TaxID=992286 RepID=A0A4R2RI85_9RHOB|nr:GNAT family N-acetyltransferase [Rhodovulum bhavnagarense]TCP62179.1 phosphinothricin acetyltransferase [Rhodovulum bhavnagarense]
MTVRSANVTDADVIAAIWGHYIRDTLVTFNATEKTPCEVAAMIAGRQAEGLGFFVVAQADRVLGFATYSQFRGGVGYARTMEHTILLAPSVRGRGLGRMLLGAVEDHASAGGAHSILAGVSSANPDGIAFHAAMGYVEIARLPEVGHKAGRWLDLVLMQKFL